VENTHLSVLVALRTGNLSGVETYAEQVASAAAAAGHTVTLVVAGPDGFAGELLADAGGENAAGDNPLPFFRLSAEAAVRAAPEAIVLCGIDAPPGRSPIPGLEKTRVTTLRSTALLHPGPRLPEALSDLTAALRR